MDFLRKNKRGALFLDMGLGKTVVSLTVAKELLDDFAVDKILVIAPKRVAEDTWTRESAKWDHLNGLRISKVLGSAKDREKALKERADIYVINRENVQWLVEYLNGDWPFDLVIIDELSSFKSPTAKRFRMLRRVIKMSDYVWGLTGTPAANGYMDLWAQAFLIDSGESLGKTITYYRDTFFRPGMHNGHIVYEWVLKKGSKEIIDARLSEKCLSMSKEDWIKLPDIMYDNIVVKMSKVERKVYDKFSVDKIIPILQDKVSDIDSMDKAVVGDTAAVVSNKLLQMANGSVYDDSEGVFHLHDHKLDALEEIVEFANDNVLVFYSYKHDLSRILKRFPEARKLEDDNTISDWNAGKIKVLLAHPASAAYGLNLQEAGHTIVWFGMPWSLEQYSQANARLHRQGQTHPVNVHHIICEDTLDERVLQALSRKDATQRGLLDALKGYIKEKL